jgi:hypothetical protein
MVSDKKTLNLVRKKLRQPDIRAALSDAFAAVGFTPLDALVMHVAHIRGFERTVVIEDADGGSHTEVVCEKPSYQALRDYESFAFPKAPDERRVRVQSENVHVNVDASGEAGVMRFTPPPTRHRVLGSGVPVDG